MGVPLALQALIASLIVMRVGSAKSIELGARWLPAIAIVNVLLMFGVWAVRLRIGALPPI